ncbi:MAG: ADP/ATP-dependent (S)-NAD(P)H-hydrate dehydratase, partial [Patescibacteria group bacterium]
VGKVAEQLKSQLSSFIWIPWDEVDAYIEKSDAVLIGPGFLRYRSEKKQVTSNKLLDGTGKKTREITERLLKKFPNKQWVIDAGSLQTMDPEWIPENAILTPNKKEFEMLFEANLANQLTSELVEKMAKRYNCIIVLKGETTIVCPPAGGCVEVTGGNPGLTKGGTGDVLAGLTVALAAKNNPFLAATAASWIIKKAADELYERVGIVYNADDVASEIPVIFSLQSLSKVDK